MNHDPKDITDIIYDTLFQNKFEQFNPDLVQDAYIEDNIIYFNFMGNSYEVKVTISEDNECDEPRES